MRTRLLGLAVTVVISSACGAVAADEVAGIVGPRAWIDAPLSGSTLPLDPYEVVAHATSPVGVASFEFSVNQAVQASAPGASGQTLETLHQLWTPPAPGTYLLSVRASDVNGDVGPAAQALVTVEGAAPPAPEAPGEAPTPESEQPPASEPDAPPPPPTEVPPPQPEAPAPADTQGPTFVRISSAPQMIYQGASSCGPTEVTITALVEDPSGVQDVFLFYRLVVPGVAPDPVWQSTGMSGVGDGNYQATLQAAGMTDLGGAPQGTLELYVVAGDGVGNTSQSGTDASVKVDACDETGPPIIVPPGPLLCGNGVVDRGEVCDEGSANGTCGHCNNTCSGSLIC